MRRATFLYQDGVVLCATLRALDELSLIEPSLAGERTVAELLPGAEELGWGYLRVGLRTLASEGWLAEPPTLSPQTTTLRWTDAGRAIAARRPVYAALGRFLAEFESPAPDAWSTPWSDARAALFTDLVAGAAERWQLADLPEPLRARAAMHLDGALAIPALLTLRATGALGFDGPVPPPGAFGHSAAQLLEILGFTDITGRWTQRGEQAAEFSAYWGIVGSYLPLLGRLADLYLNRVGAPGETTPDGHEWHVNRALNVIASGAAHRRYFSDADAIFLELFARPGARPSFVADIGCGDASWLIHLDRLLRERGADREPPLMVGIDCNEDALAQARVELDRAGVRALLIDGDVGDPDAVARSLAEHGLEMTDGLHIRAFVDHDRGYRPGDVASPPPGWASGAYVAPDGRTLDGREVERDLVEHFRRWAPYAVKHGLVVLEAHSVAPRIASRHLGALHSVAFDSYHGYSHQYPIEYAAFVRCARAAGLALASDAERHYPSSRPFVAVSLNRLLGARPDGALPGIDPARERLDTWRPPLHADLADGRGLHELLYAGGDLRYPRSWCGAATGWVVAEALAAIAPALERASDGDVVRVLDYGTGSGLAAIELLKACRERGIDELLSARGATLELHLADLPSSWFAQGYELLRDCAWTRFHSLLDDRGTFRRLQAVTGGAPMDAVISNMVFHLVPPRALSALSGELAGVLSPDGRLVWSSPDLGPPSAHAVLFHDANRALRARWLELLDGGAVAPNGSQGGAGSARALSEALAQAAALGDSARREAALRADRRILPRAHTARQVTAALQEHLSGVVERRTYEMLDEEILAALLVPSNQDEYLAEIPDARLREQVIGLLMETDVLPAMRETPAGTSLGLSVQWTLGSFARR